MSEVVANPEYDFIPIEEVFALRSLAMGVVAEQARRKLDKPKTTGFVLLESTGEAMGSNAVETYLGVIAKKLTYDYWQLTVSFRSTMLNEKLRYSNTLELNRFNWNQQGICVGTKVFTDNYYPVISTREDPEGGTIDTVQPHVVEWQRPLFISDCDDIADRMLEIDRKIQERRS